MHDLIVSLRSLSRVPASSTGATTTCRKCRTGWRRASSTSTGDAVAPEASRGAHRRASAGSRRRAALRPAARRAPALAEAGPRACSPCCSSRLALLVYRVAAAADHAAHALASRARRGLDKDGALGRHRAAPASAAIAAEDNRFCEHGGFDWPELRGQLDRALAGEPARGASTLTMQTAKNLLLWPGRDPVRKLLEAWLTPQIELLWGKRRIMEVYLNVAETGPGPLRRRGRGAAPLRQARERSHAPRGGPDRRGPAQPEGLVASAADRPRRPAGADHRAPGPAAWSTARLRALSGA